MAVKLKFYLDENIPIAVAVQLKRRGVEAVTVRDLGYLADSDVNHLTRAAAMGYVLCTHDADFVDLAAHGASHAGIVFGQQHKHGIGAWVRYLELLAAFYQPEDLKDRVEYL